MSNAFHIEQMEPLPPDVNPFHYDQFHMGEYLGKNLCVMYSEHPEIDYVPQNQGYIILIHVPTGQRLKITFPENNPEKISGEVMNWLMGGV